MACQHPELAGTAPAAGPARLADDKPARLRALLDRPATLRESLQHADAVFAPSRFLADMFVANRCAHPRLMVLPYGLEPGRIVPLPTPRPRQPLRIGFCGVMSPWKAPHLLVAAMAQVTAPCEVRLHGRIDEPMFAEFIATMRAAAAHDPRIQFPGSYGHAEAAAVFAAMDVLVVPSVWYENTPFVVLEAFAAGVPVVASDLGGLAEVVRHGENGFLFRAGDAAALGALLQQLASEPQRLQQLTMPQPPGIAGNYDAFAAAYRTRSPV